MSDGGPNALLPPYGARSMPAAGGRYGSVRRDLRESRYVERTKGFGHLGVHDPLPVAMLVFFVSIVRRVPWSKPVPDVAYQSRYDVQELGD